MDVWCGDIGEAWIVSKTLNPCYFESITSLSLLFLAAVLAVVQVGVLQ